MIATSVSVVIAMVAAIAPAADASTRRWHPHWWNGGRPRPSAPAAPASPSPSAPVASAAPSGSPSAPVAVVPSPSGTAQPAPDGAAPIGGGLNSQPNYSIDFMFTDAMKTSGHYRDPENLDREAPVDERGWPTGDFAVYVSETSLPLGTYHLSYQAKTHPQISVMMRPATVGSDVYDAATGTGSAEITLTGSGEHTVLRLTGTGGGARGIRLIRPGYDAANPPTFTTGYLANLRSVNPTVLRFMDFAETNFNVVTSWNERTRPDDARQTATLTKETVTGRAAGAKGAAWEYAIELANTMHTDAWVNVPSEADDDYVRNLATMLRDKLDPSHRVWVEYSNEVWNDGFPQTQRNREHAKQEVASGNSNLDDLGGDEVQWGDRRVARRIMEISKIFGATFGAGAVPNGRVRPVLAYQYVNTWRTEQQLKYLDATYGRPGGYLYAASGAVYFNTSAVDKRTDATKDQVLDALAAAADESMSYLGDNVALAGKYGLKYTAYEAGPDTFGPNNIQAKKAANLDPRMRTICERFLRAWFAKGGDQLNWFTLGATNYETPYGTWGATNDIANTDSPKMQALRAVRATALTSLRTG